MDITIKIIYQGYAAKLMQRGDFTVNRKRYEKYPDHEAAYIAYDWLKEIRKKGHVKEIIEVIYNDDQDITVLVKKLDNVRFQDNLPF
jgi:gamma-glutamyl-gamma-aminobutyrate hydrolase PuuD